MVRRMLRRPATWAVLGVIAAGLVFGLYWFQPWKLFTDKTVNEALPVVASPTSGEPTQGANLLLASGTLVSHEHETSGTVRLVRLTDGRVQVAIADLDTSDGPDLRVWLTDRPVTPDGWHVFDDGRYVELGRLRANHGNQVYDVPAGTDLTGLTSVTIWCKRFAVSFGAAQLRPA